MENFVEKFDFAWSWMCLGASLVFLVLLFFTDLLRSNLNKPRWEDAGWFAWVAAPMYMFHQFEEYAFHYDWKTLSHPFADMICQKVGYGAYPDCPIPLQHYWIVNISLWFFAMFGAWKFYKYNPMVALAPYGLILSNGLLHIVGWLLSDNTLLDYPSGGTITSIALFIPVTILMIRACLKGKVMSGWAITATLIAGLIGHLILFGAYASLDAGGVVALYTFDFFAMSSPLLLAWIASKWLLNPKNSSTTTANKNIAASGPRH